jgi:glycosyltransferase involved in cell wall biosynthesis
MTSPLFSIVLINRDDPRHLKNCLKSLRSLKYSTDAFEVIIVDDGSSIPLEQQIDFVLDFVHSFHYIVLTHDSCRSRARNLGASFAKYPVLVFVDGDQVITPDLLTHYSEYINKNPSGARVVLGTRVDLLPWQQDACLASLDDNSYTTKFLPLLRHTKDPKVMLLEYLNLTFAAMPENWSLFISCNFMIFKDTFENAGGFDERFKTWGFEDTEFAYRLAQQGVVLDFMDNKVLNFPPERLLTEEKYRYWVENFQVFYDKYKDKKILAYYGFENMLFSILTDKPPINWFELFRTFITKMAYYNK